MSEKEYSCPVCKEKVNEIFEHLNSGKCNPDIEKVYINGKLSSVTYY